MRLPWLEQMTKEGSISQGQKAAIYAGCEALVKVADSEAEAVQRITSAIMAFAAPTIMGLAPVAAGLALDHRHKMRNEQVHREGQQRTLDALLADPHFQTHKELAAQRYGEVLNIAPTVAANTPLLTAILKKKLHSGFSHDDITGLAKIQATYSPNFGFQQRLSPQVKTASEADAGAQSAGRITANSYLLCKEAGVFDGRNARFIGNALLQTGAAAAVSGLLAASAGGINAALAHRDRKMQQASLMRSFNMAMDPNHPGSDRLNADPMKAREVFDSLVHFAPHVALQPTAARTFMNKVIEHDVTGRGALQTPDLKELTEIERNLRGAAGGNAFLQGFVPGLAETGFKDSLSKSRAAFQDPMFQRMENDAAGFYGMSVKPDKQRYEAFASAGSPRGSSYHGLNQRARS